MYGIWKNQCGMPFMGYAESEAIAWEWIARKLHEEHNDWAKRHGYEVTPFTLKSISYYKHNASDYYTVRPIKHISDVEF